MSGYKTQYSTYTSNFGKKYQNSDTNEIGSSKISKSSSLAESLMKTRAFLDSLENKKYTKQSTPFGKLGNDVKTYTSTIKKFQPSSGLSSLNSFKQKFASFGKTDYSRDNSPILRDSNYSIHKKPTENKKQSSNVTTIIQETKKIIKLDDKSKKSPKNEKPYIPPFKTPLKQISKSANKKIDTPGFSDIEPKQIYTTSTPPTKSPVYSAKIYKKTAFSTGKKEVNQELKSIKYFPDLVKSLSSQVFESSQYRKSLSAYDTNYTAKHFFDTIASSRRISATLKDLKLFLKWTVFSLKGLDELESQTLFYIIDQDKDNILSWADFSYFIGDTEGDLKNEDRAAETQRAKQYAIQKLKNNPSFVGDGWERFKKQVRLKSKKILGMKYEEAKQQQMEFYQLGGLNDPDTSTYDNSGTKVEYVVVAIIVQIMLNELDGFKKAEAIKKMVKQEYGTGEYLRNLFDKCDTRKQGKLDRFDFYKIGRLVDENFSVKDARRALYMMDTKDKGYLTFKDFKKYLELYGKLPDEYLEKFDAGENETYFLDTERSNEIPSLKDSIDAINRVNRENQGFDGTMGISELTESKITTINQSLENITGLGELTRSKQFESMYNDQPNWKKTDSFQVDDQRKTKLGVRQPTIEVTRTVITGGIESEVASLNSDYDTNISPLKNLQRFKGLTLSTDSLKNGTTIKLDEVNDKFSKKQPTNQPEKQTIKMTTIMHNQYSTKDGIKTQIKDDRTGKATTNAIIEEEVLDGDSSQRQFRTKTYQNEHKINPETDNVWTSENKDMKNAIKDLMLQAGLKGLEDSQPQLRSVQELTPSESMSGSHYVTGNNVDGEAILHPMLGFNRKVKDFVGSDLYKNPEDLISSDISNNYRKTGNSKGERNEHNEYKQIGIANSENKLNNDENFHTFGRDSSKEFTPLQEKRQPLDILYHQTSNYKCKRYSEKSKDEMPPKYPKSEKKIISDNIIDQNKSHLQKLQMVKPNMVISGLTVSNLGIEESSTPNSGLNEKHRIGSISSKVVPVSIDRLPSKTPSKNSSFINDRDPFNEFISPKICTQQKQYFMRGRDPSRFSAPNSNFKIKNWENLRRLNIQKGKINSKDFESTDLTGRRDKTKNFTTDINVQQLTEKLMKKAGKEECLRLNELDLQKGESFDDLDTFRQGKDMFDSFLSIDSARDGDWVRELGFRDTLKSSYIVDDKQF